MKTKTTFKVRTYECDSYGHVNNAVYLNYLEYGRMDFLNQIGFDYKGIVAEGYFIYVSHVDIYYKSSAYFDDDLTIESYSTKLKSVSGTIHQTIANQNGVVCAEADVTWCCVNKDTGRPSKVPDKFMVEGLKPEPPETV
ncbi:MAG: acyl-CoA thioesterase [Treponema sp.]|nr:acyl-CoA thioesterase [Treponema sp.]MBR1614214.1 acyl-CoA thioesterase [Treponema sp.]MBR1714817.1 acyl-CoA thioesterase [Treponema sp.]